MRLKVADQVERSEWDATACALGGNVFHSSAWADHIRIAEPGSVPMFCSLIADSGEQIGIALGFRFRSKRPVIAAMTGKFRMDALPVVKDNDPTRFAEFVCELETHSRDAGDVALVLGSFASPRHGDALEDLGFSTTRRLEFQIPLVPSEDELWKKLAHKRRKNIKKAGRLGVTVHDLSGAQGIAELRRLQGDSSQRIVARGGPDITRKCLLAEDPVGVFLDAGVGRIVVAELGGQIVSASLFTFFNGLVYHTLSGHSNEGTKAQAPTMVLWETIKRYRQEGAERFNFGGCSAGAVEKGSPEYGVYDYKKAFGGECIECSSGRKVLRPVRSALLRAIKRVVGKK